MDLTRRLFLKSGLGAAGGWLAAGSAPAPAAARTEDPYTAQAPGDPDPHQRLAIVNADDLGMSAEVDRGIFEALDRGIVTSASLLVDGPHAVEAARQARQRSDVSLGIHVAFDEHGGWLVDNVPDPRIVNRELTRQLEAFVQLTGAPPTHIDSHHHVHRRFNVAWQFLEVGRRYGAPVRGFSEVYYVGRFYGQPEWGRTDVTKISADYLLTVLRSLGPGISEVSCHPGRLEPRPDAEYNREREVELRSLCDAKVKAAIADEGIRLISFREYRQLAAHRGKGLLAGGCPPTASSR
jgi:predicted glycoside hydrolase/deacetylase ChbG (UPF0249 family)